MTPDPIYAPAFLLVELQIRGAGTRAQAYTNSITNNAIVIGMAFKAQTHAGNTSQPSLIISFIFILSSIILLTLTVKGIMFIIMKDKKITMWWNLPPEEIDELRDAGQLQAFTCVEYNDDDESGDNNETNHIQQ